MRWLWFCGAWVIVGIFFGGCVVNKYRDWTEPDWASMRYPDLGTPPPIGPGIENWRFELHPENAVPLGGRELGSPSGEGALGGQGGGVFGLGGGSGTWSGGGIEDYGWGGTPVWRGGSLIEPRPPEGGGWMTPLLLGAAIPVGALLGWKHRKALCGLVHRATAPAASESRVA